MPRRRAREGGPLGAGSDSRSCPGRYTLKFFARDNESVRSLYGNGMARTEERSYLRLELAKIGRIYLERLLPWHVEGLLLNKRVHDMLSPGGLSKDGPVVDRALP